MKPLIQKLPLTERTSFVAQTFRTPDFEVGWHQHSEYELILFTEGSGFSFIGNDVSEFETGDVYLLGSDLPHSFQKKEPGMIASAVVVQFVDDCWGKNFLERPECQPVKKLLETSHLGLKVIGKSRQLLYPIIKALETALNFQRFLLLGECLDIISSGQEYIAISTSEIAIQIYTDRETIDRVFQFTMDRFHEPVTLAQIAGIACMSVPAFCTFFKKSTKKTYIEFLNEVRIGNACSLLMETDKNILDVCFESGYESIGNFHKQFLKIKGRSPLQFRKYFSDKLSLPQNNIHILEVSR